MSTYPSDTLLEVNQLKTIFNTSKGEVVAVDEVSFKVNKGEIVGIVGESGCGKSVTSQSILRLLDEKRLVRYEGDIKFKGENLIKLTPKQMRKVRGKNIAMIFQDPMSSLNPVLTIGYQLIEAIRIHHKISRRAAKLQAIALLRQTGIPSPEQRVDEYPHQLSGGMKQRVMIAMALAGQPELLIADEPTTALDVTIQSQILYLLKELNLKYDMSMILITHDLGVIAQVCDRVMVMYLGEIVEEATVFELFHNPKHPYTKSLINAIPRLDTNKDEKLPVVGGQVPSLHHIPVGCRFASRCEWATDKCRAQQKPPIKYVSELHYARCWYTSTDVAEQTLVKEMLTV